MVVTPAEDQSVIDVSRTIIIGKHEGYAAN